MAETQGPRYLPGDPQPPEDLARMIRVDQAGEFGAVRIYAGQMAVLGRRGSGAVIREMAEQEQEHLDRFNGLMVERRVRPTVLSPLWHVAGYALGAGTALLGERAAMACTVAVEDVIDEHYEKQAQKLGDTEPELKSVIEQFQADEQAHRDTALEHGATGAPGYPVLSAAIKAGSRLAIWLSERI
ncbi:MAG: demethoxyubiquinone hydroxylase family protein [Alphaproteobacteria bacterium]|nr:demethoxyubiquinone hydroxylase family protein [Alphaproteobacteria bacterium]